MGSITSALKEIGEKYMAGVFSRAELDGLHLLLTRYYLSFYRGLSALETCIRREPDETERRLLAAALEDLCLRRRDLAEKLQPLLIRQPAALWEDHAKDQDAENRRL